MYDNTVTVAYINNEGDTRPYTPMQLMIRLLKWCDRRVIELVPVHLPGVHNVQDWPDSHHWTDSGHDVSSTSVCQVGRTTDRHVCYIRQQMTKQVLIAISGPQGRVDGCHVHPLGQWEGPPVCFPAIQVGLSGPAEDLQYVPRNMHTVCAVYWLSDAVACSGLKCMGRVWDFAHQFASDIC